VASIGDKKARTIQVTHVGSLPRPPGLCEILLAKAAGATWDSEVLNSCVRDAVMDVVALQTAAGCDIVSDGEMGKLSYTMYIVERLSGFGGNGRRLGLGPADLAANPQFAAHLKAIGEDNPLVTPACVGPVAVKDHTELLRDLNNLSAAVTAHGARGGFMPSPSPGVIAQFMPNHFYASEDEYIEALADAMRPEYEAIVGAGFELQVDAPDLALGRHTKYRDASVATFLTAAHRNVEAINRATRNIAPDQMRLHICWGNYPGPHTHDIPLDEIFDIVMRARPSKLLFESANPRHAHEWETFETNKNRIPDDKILVPGVIDTNTNCVEHPDLVAQRLRNFIRIVGQDRVMGGTDCGFSSVAVRPRVFPSLVWQKLESLAEGARRACHAA
jgi:5-methyltetrahydropteroyltriglutamate--homocysteine methyltransferase